MGFSDEEWVVEISCQHFLRSRFFIGSRASVFFVSSIATLNKSILIVDDEVAIREMVRMALETDEFTCLEAGATKEAHSIIVDQAPDLVLLDWMLPDGSGIDLLSRLRRDELTRELPVIMLTAKVAEQNIVRGLEVGADDYITKPFARKELIARVQSLLRRSKPELSLERYQVSDLILDATSHRVFAGSDLIDLGPTEFKLLLFLMQHPERVYSRSQLLDHVWGANVYVEDRTVDVHIRRLRKALQLPRKDYSKLIQTVRGAGYRFSERNF